MTDRKLYWRVKKHNKWTWRPVVIDGSVFWAHLASHGLTLWDIETRRFTDKQLAKYLWEEE